MAAQSRLIGGRSAIAVALLLVALLAAPPARSASFLTTLGFADDVDLVTSENGEILLICEESPAGAGQLRIMDLNAATGGPLGIAQTRVLPGFEAGVDPIAVSPVGVAGSLVIVPYESRNGATAGVLVMNLNDSGAVILGREVNINLGNLGFRPDVDPVIAPYPTLMAFFPLESADQTVRGALVVDIDPADAGGDGLNAFGSCTLLSTDGRVSCGAGVQVDWLPGLADGVDPLGYQMLDRVRFMLPVVSGFDRPDIQLMDFDGTFEPPEFLGHSSVRALNTGSARPTEFPGFERDVDLALLDGPALCDLGARSILVPVEGPGNVADLYLLDENGMAIWTLSHDSGTTLRIPGYQIGVDPLILCGLGGAAPGRIALPIENAANSDADLWIISLATGALIARVENPALNPGLVIPGFEIGVDPLRWTEDYFVVPVERPDRVGGLLVFDNLGVLQSSHYFGGGLGFARSVDPIVAPLPDPERSLWVPVAREDLSDANVHIFRDPPSLVLGATNLETLNPGLTLGGSAWDVDAGFVEKVLPGQAFLFVPEQNAAGQARVRFEAVPSVGRYLALLCGALPSPGPAPSLYFFRVGNGTLNLQFHDLLGLAPGLDMAHGRGPATPGNPPAQALSPGYDADTDPTLAWLPGGVSAAPIEEPRESRPWRLRHANPFSPRDRILVNLTEGAEVRVDIVDAAGRRVTTLHEGWLPAGEQAFSWDGRAQNRRPVAGGIYFLQVRGARGGIVVSKLVLSS